MKKNNFKLIILTLLISITSISCSKKEEDTNEKNDLTENNNPLVYTGETTNDRLTDNEERFYKDKIPNKELVATLNGNCNSLDSGILNNEIESLANEGGGVIRIPKGTYCLRDIILRSNIHLRIDPEAIIEPDLSGNIKNKNITIFVVGEDFYLENVSITNLDEDNTDKSTWFKSNIPNGEYGGVKLVEFGNVKNFKLSGVTLTDSFSKFSNIVLNLPASSKTDEISTKGIIKDVFMTNMHVGYGVIQMQTGRSILCKNINGEGGITMRVETGAAGTNMVNEKTVDDIVVRDIYINKGDAAMNFSPHRVDQGRVDVERVVATNSSHAVQIAAGFLDNNTNGVNNLGTFDSRSYVGDIIVTGGYGAQVKGKDYKYFSCDKRKELIEKCYNPDDESVTGSSISAVRDNASVNADCANGGDGGCYEIIIGRITKTNEDFELDDFFTYPSSDVKGCPKVKKPEEGN
uniref:Iota-carrageenase n=1 Tax=Cellulophaga sp. QY3 TaxID=362829 RepID=R9UQG9_9FLAO|nr:iota-carrageenase [Cellulophaga sp. QY3]